MVTKKACATPLALLGIFVGAMLPLAFAVAIAADGTWTFNVNTLSDLGISSSQVAADIFNYSCMIGGVLVAVFGFGKFLIKDGKDAASGLFLAATGVLFMAVGIITKDSYSLHVSIAIMGGLTLLIGAFIGTVSDWSHGRQITASVGAIAVTLSVATFFGLAFAGFEVVSIISGLIWLIAEGASLAFSKD